MEEYNLFLTMSFCWWQLTQSYFWMGLSESEVDSFLEGGAGPLKPSYPMGPVTLHSELAVCGLGIANWVWTFKLDRWKENKNKPMGPGQRLRGLEEGQGGHMMTRQKEAKSPGLQGEG